MVELWLFSNHLCLHPSFIHKEIIKSFDTDKRGLPSILLNKKKKQLLSFLSWLKYREEQLPESSVVAERLHHFQRGFCVKSLTCWDVMRLDIWSSSHADICSWNIKRYWFIFKQGMKKDLGFIVDLHIQYLNIAFHIMIMHCYICSQK